MNYDFLAELTRIPSRWEHIQGMCDFEALYEHAVSEAPPGSLLVEVGAYLGRSVCHLGTLAKQADKELRVVAVDRCTGSTSDETGHGLAAALGGSYAGVLARNVAACGLADVVSVVVQDSARAAELFAPGSAWFVFLDADHAREAVARDMKAWASRVAPGGIFAGHDYSQVFWPGVVKAVAEMFGEGDWRSPHSPSCWEMRV